MLTQRSVTLAVRSAGIESPARFVPATGSTNSDLLAMAQDGAPEWTVLVTGHQVAGRGRLGRTWVDAEGKSLPVSVLLRPQVSPSEASLLALAAAASMARACRQVAGADVLCKWPNDLVVGGRKLGGVLAETRVQGERVAHVVLGIGVNLTQGPQDFPVELRERATSLSIERARADAAQLLSAYVAALRELYSGGTGFGHRVLEAYRPLCSTVGRTVHARTLSGGEVVGLASGVGDGGELLVETRLGLARVAFGEVAHLD